MVASMSTGDTENGETPIAYANPEDEALEGNASDIAARKNIDAMWRTLVVTPLCLTELGSIEACEQYGAELVTSLGQDLVVTIYDVKRDSEYSCTATCSALI